MLHIAPSDCILEKNVTSKIKVSVILWIGNISDLNQEYNIKVD